MIRVRNWIACAVALTVIPLLAQASGSPITFQPKDFLIIRRESGPVNYFHVLGDGSDIFLRGEYHPPLKTEVLGVKIPKLNRKEPRKLRWRWRVQAFPKGGNECIKDKRDSAATVYLTFKDGLHWYTLKYVWSTEAPKGAVCDSRRSPVVSQDSIVLESGGPLNQWVTEEIDPSADFRKQFRKGDPKGHVPDLVGIGIMTDGDQTKSDSVADFGAFELGP